MIPLLFLFHGEQILLYLLIALLISVAVLSAVSYFLTKLLRKRFGGRAYLAIPAPFLLAFLALYLIYRSEMPSSGPPEVVSQSEATRLVEELPAYTSFSYSGAGFYGKVLYVSTNVGLFEIGEGVPKLHRFQKKYSVVSGPWIDVANRLLWVDDNQTNEFLNYDGKEWKRIAHPTPQKGYYSRGDILSGAKLVGNAEGFWLASGGSAWQWDSARSTWKSVNTGAPQRIDRALVGIVPIRDKPFVIVRHELLDFLVKEKEFRSDTIHDVSQNMKEVPVRGSAFFADSAAATLQGALICTRDGRILQVTVDAVFEVPTPGACEALASVHQVGAIASFKKEGIFRWDQAGGWHKLASHPYPSGEGDYWSYLATDGERIAYVMNGKPSQANVSSGSSNMTFTKDAPTKLWIIRGDQATEIDLRSPRP
jgi:hypothetical protein